MRVEKETTVRVTMTDKEHRDLVAMLRDFRSDLLRASAAPGNKIDLSSTPEYRTQVEIMLDRLEC